MIRWSGPGKIKFNSSQDRKLNSDLIKSHIIHNKQYQIYSELNETRNSVYTHSFHFYGVTGVRRLVKLLNADVGLFARRHLDQSASGAAAGGVHDNRCCHNLRTHRQNSALYFIWENEFPTKNHFIRRTVTSM